MRLGAWQTVGAQRPPDFPTEDGGEFGVRGQSEPASSPGLQAPDLAQTGAQGPDGSPACSGSTPSLRVSCAQVPQRPDCSSTTSQRARLQFEFCRPLWGNGEALMPAHKSPGRSPQARRAYAALRNSQTEQQRAVASTGTGGDLGLGFWGDINSIYCGGRT